MSFITLSLYTALDEPKEPSPFRGKLDWPSFEWGEPPRAPLRKERADSRYSSRKSLRGALKEGFSLLTCVCAKSLKVF